MNSFQVFGTASSRWKRLEYFFCRLGIVEVLLPVVKDVDVAVEHHPVGLAVPLGIELAVGGHHPIEVVAGPLVLGEIVVQRLELAGLRERAEEQARVLNPVEPRTLGEKLGQDLGHRVAPAVVLAALDADPRLLLQVRREPERRMEPVRVLEVGEIDVVEELLAGRHRLGPEGASRQDRGGGRRAGAGGRVPQELASRVGAEDAHVLSSFFARGACAPRPGYAPGHRGPPPVTQAISASDEALNTITSRGA